MEKISKTWQKRGILENAVVCADVNSTNRLRDGIFGYTRQGGVTPLYFV